MRITRMRLRSPLVSHFKFSDEELEKMAKIAYSLDAKMAVGSLMQPVLVASNDPGGVALINGTPTIATAFAPSDGHYHTCIVEGCSNVSSTETGGQVQAVLQNAAPVTISPGGSSGGAAVPGGTLGLIPSGNSVQINQSTALTVGAAQFVYNIWITP